MFIKTHLSCLFLVWSLRWTNFRHSVCCFQWTNRLFSVTDTQRYEYFCAQLIIQYSWSSRFLIYFYDEPSICAWHYTWSPHLYIQMSTEKMSTNFISSKLASDIWNLTKSIKSCYVNSQPFTSRHKKVCTDSFSLYWKYISHKFSIVSAIKYIH